MDFKCRVGKKVETNIVVGSISDLYLDSYFWMSSICEDDLLHSQDKEIRLIFWKRCDLVLIEGWPQVRKTRNVSCQATSQETVLICCPWACRTDELFILNLHVFFCVYSTFYKHSKKSVSIPKQKLPLIWYNLPYQRWLFGDCLFNPPVI